MPLSFISFSPISREIISYQHEGYTFKPDPILYQLFVLGFHIVFIYVCNINTMKHLLFFSLLLLTTPIFSQIKVEDVGDGWKNKIELALDLIKRTDSNYYNHVIDNCEHIGFWAGKYSTNEGTSIYMTKYDFEMNSIQNLACIIVHESKHIEFSKNKIIH